jgi:hypothetical protein
VLCRERADHRIAKALQLDRLGPDSKPAVLPDDPMLPPGHNDLARQIALRIFQATLYADAFSSCGFSDMQTMPPTVFPIGERGLWISLT